MKKTFSKMAQTEITYQMITNQVDSIIPKIGSNLLKNYSDKNFRKILENYIYQVLYPYLFEVSEDEEMKNKQIKEKTHIL